MVCALALALRLLALGFTPHYVPINDAADFDRIGASIAEQGRYPASQLAPGPTAFRAPGFPVLLAATYRLTGASAPAARWRAGRLLEVALGVLAVALVALLGVRLGGPGLGLTAGVLAAIYPPLVLVGTSLMSEPLYIVLALAAVLAALHAWERPAALRWALLSGVLLGLLALTRANFVVLAIPLCALTWGSGAAGRRATLGAPLALLAACALTLTPWLIRDSAQFHQFVPLSTEGGFALVGQYNAEAQARRLNPALWTPPVVEARALAPQLRGLDEAQVSDRFTARGLAYAEAHPAFVAKVLWWNARRLLGLAGMGFERYIEPTFSYPPGLAGWSVPAFWLLAALTVGGLLCGAATLVPRALWGVPVLIVLASVPVIGAARYRVPADPFLLVAAAVALRTAWLGLMGLSAAPVPSPSA